MNAKTALIYGFSMIIGLCAHSWLQRPDPFRRPHGMPPTASLKFSVIQVDGTSTGVLAIDRLNGEMWAIQLRGGGKREWVRVTEGVERADFFGDETSDVMEARPEQTSYSDTDILHEMGLGGEASPDAAAGQADPDGVGFTR